MSERREYVLGTGGDELARLGLQHRLWSDAATASWQRAGIKPGWRVLDVGCGPGFAALDLAPMVGAAGAVLGVDESQDFIAHVRDQATARRLPWLQGRVGDVQALDGVLADTAPFDLAYARWVLCFVKDPEAVVRGVARHLKSGGVFVLHEYFNYGAMTLAPRRRSHELAVAATMRSWRDKGGDPDIAARLPAMLATHGFRLEAIVPHNRVARGQDAMFAWIDSWWRTFAPKLVGMGLLAAADCERLLADLTEVERSGTDWVQCPVVYELIARKL